MATISLRILESQRQFRPDYTGNELVEFHRIGGLWQPINGRWVKRKMGNLMVNVLCHDNSKEPSENYYDNHNSPYSSVYSY